jgi:hypothetical protein
MICKPAILVVMYSIISAACVNGPGYDRALAKPAELPTVTGSATDCLPEGELFAAFQKLSFGKTESEANQAQAILVNNSQKSPECRLRVIAVIVKAMDKANRGFSQDPSMYAVWHDGAELLGELKAGEALDFLISHLDLKVSGLSSTTMSHQPALAGVIKMGPIAIPKLSALLKDSPDTNMRRYAIYCIAGIGGPLATRALKEAVALESDQCVKRFIAVSIDTINESGGLKNNTVNWYMAFQCQ